MLIGFEVTGSNCFRNATFLAVSRGALMCSLAAESSSPDESTQRLLHAFADQHGRRPEQVARLGVVVAVQFLVDGFPGHPTA